MATASELRALMAIRCPWCGAGPSEPCFPAHQKNRRTWQGGRSKITTLEAGCHEARWKAAVLREPEGVVAALYARHGPPERPW